MSECKEDHVWVFLGTGATHASAVFITFEKAESWIDENILTGILTEYPLDISIYDWVVKKGYWSPSKPYHSTPKFKERFSSAYLRHYHYEDGKKD